MDAEVVVQLLADYAKEDASFQPIKSQCTMRWHLTVGGRHFELLLDGPKFFDTLQKRGGGGAIDLVMHLFGLDFKGAVERLRSVVL